jgi:hypothetical protein
MVKNTYDHLEFALKEKGFWTPADEIRPVKGALMEFPGLENSSRKGVSERMAEKPLVDISVRVEIRTRAKNFEEAERIAKSIIGSIPKSGLYSILTVAPYRFETIDEDSP